MAWAQSEKLMIDAWRSTLEYWKSTRGGCAIGNLHMSLAVEPFLYMETAVCLPAHLSCCLPACIYVCMVVS